MDLQQRTHNTITRRRFFAVAALLAIAAGISASAQFRGTVIYHTVGAGSRTASVEAYLVESVDEQPHFPGGDGAMVQFINRERKYPRSAYENRVQGRVLCGFIVNEKGEIGNIEVLRGVEDSLNEEAVRIIRRMPHWIAGKIAGKPVNVYYILPVSFRL